MSKNQVVSRLKLSKTVVTKLLKDLDKKGLISSFKTKDRQRVVYMGAEYLPDELLTGGLFYKEGQIDSEGVQNYLDTLFRIIL